MVRRRLLFYHSIIYSSIYGFWLPVLLSSNNACRGLLEWTFTQAMLIPAKWFKKKKNNFILDRSSHDENYIKCWGFNLLNVSKKRNRVKIYRRKEMTIYYLVLCVKRATQYLAFPIWLFDYCLASIKLYFKLIKIRSLTHFPLLIWHGMGDLRKPHYGSHAIDPIDPTDAMKMLRAAFILRAIRLAEKLHSHIYHIIIYSWHTVTHTPWHISKEGGVRDRILIRFPEFQLQVYSCSNKFRNQPFCK